MTERTWWETTKVQGKKVKQLVHEGFVRRIVIKHGDRTVARFPLTAGVVGAVFVPIRAVVVAIAALVTNCSITVEPKRTSNAPAEVPRPPGTVDSQG